MKAIKNYQCEGQMSIFDVFNLDMGSTKMCPEPSVQTTEKISEQSSKRQRKSSIKTPLFLDLRTASGLLQEPLWEEGGVLLGVYTMHSFGESPSVEKESRLSQILEENPHPKYSLSAKACQGILNRANRRGKKLPEQLETALIRQASLSRLGGGVDVDSNGKRAGKGALIQTELSGTLGVSQDQTLIQTDGKCLNPWDVQSKHIQPQDGIAEALYSGECRGGGGESYVMQDKPDKKVYGISAYESNSMKSSNPNSGIYEAETTRTLDNNGGNPACNQGGMIVLEGNGSRPSHKGDGYAESDVSYTLNAVEQHAVCVGNGQMCNITMKSIANTLDTMHDQQAILTIDMGGGKSSCVVEENKSPTLTTTHYGEPAVCYGVDCYNQSASEEVSKALNSAATDSDHIPCVTYGLDRASFNQGQNAKYDFSVEEELAQTLVNRGPGGTDETVGALCARDYKGVGNQYVNEGKCIVQPI